MCQAISEGCSGYIPKTGFAKTLLKARIRAPYNKPEKPSSNLVTRFEADL